MADIFANDLADPVVAYETSYRTGYYDGFEQALRTIDALLAAGQGRYAIGFRVGDFLAEELPGWVTYSRHKVEAAPTLEVDRNAKVPIAIRRAVYKRDRGLCRVCGLAVPAQAYRVRHIRPPSQGGADDPGNLALSHVMCNLRV